mmetsp:Transcript_19475/g.57729  ORF Transcript_19475/g.57729 Transcript_19475/m.57729 type:complete len:266 (-) Transcript_19475:652-1449(-)
MPDRRAPPRWTFSPSKGGASHCSALATRAVLARLAKSCSSSAAPHSHNQVAASAPRSQPPGAASARPQPSAQPRPSRCRLPGTPAWCVCVCVCLLVCRQLERNLTRTDLADGVVRDYVERRFDEDVVELLTASCHKEAVAQRTMLHTLHQLGRDAARDVHAAARQATQRHRARLGTDDVEEHVNGLDRERVAAVERAARNLGRLLWRAVAQHVGAVAHFVGQQKLVDEREAAATCHLLNLAVPILLSHVVGQCGLLPAARRKRRV